MSVQEAVICRHTRQGLRIKSSMCWKGFTLFRVLCTGSTDSKQLSGVKYMNVSKPVSVRDSGLGCMCLQRATEDELDRTLAIHIRLSGRKVVASA